MLTAEKAERLSLYYWVFVDSRGNKDYENFIFSPNRKPKIDKWTMDKGGEYVSPNYYDFVMRQRYLEEAMEKSSGKVRDIETGIYRMEECYSGNDGDFELRLIKRNKRDVGRDAVEYLRKVYLGWPFIYNESQEVYRDSKRL